MATLRIRAAAVADIRGIRHYSDTVHGTAAAQAYLADLDDALKLLREFPEIGRPEDRFRAGLRSLPCREHRIFYHFASGHISVVRVLHKAQDHSSQLM